MPTDFWSGWIVLLTVISLIGLSWLVFSVYFSTDSVEEESPIWDETLSEGSNPAPMWWFWMILAFMVFTVIYLMLFPGLGSYKGALNWSMGGRLGESYALYDYEFGTSRQQLLESPYETLQADVAVMRSARGIFNRNCAACHGVDAMGQADLFPDLTDDVWQWGGEKEQIEQSIRAGRNAVMPGWEAALGADGVIQVSEYLASLTANTQAGDSHPGQAKFQTVCSACHGPNGDGNIMLGAPDLTDDVWLYGGDNQAVMQSIADGRHGIMPAFEDRLDDVQVRMLVAWLTRD